MPFYVQGVHYNFKVIALAQIALIFEKLVKYQESKNKHKILPPYTPVEPFLGHLFVYMTQFTRYMIFCKINVSQQKKLRW